MNIHSVLFVSFFGRLLFSKLRSPGFSLCTWPLACVSLTLNRCIVYQSVADPGKEPRGGGGSPLFLAHTEAQRAEKDFSEPPLPPPPSPLSPYLKVWIRHCQLSRRCVGRQQRNAICHLTHLKISNVLMMFLDCHTIGKRLLFWTFIWFI